ncbi:MULTISPECIES: DAPG hydrolase family protein [unclassified Chryseobacterium]|uniref:DAPG hydrolase family protein n=1 Tax=unclassified Chryseobacterium TaxID=2593645 RepID=UPI001627D7B8|nr:MULTISPECIES: hydrolase [unclassified Chryseobacterium]
MRPTKETEEVMFREINTLLSPKPIALEAGINRLENGMLHIAMRNVLPQCKGKMLDWWFKYFETTSDLKLWHPHDHVQHGGWDSKWVKHENYIGATIHATESLGNIPPVPATIKFHDPAEIFDAEILTQAYASGAVSAVVYARIGFGEDTPINDNGDPVDGYMFHVVRDTVQGCTLRSHFYLGALMADSENQLSNEVGFGLMEHCYSEFTYLAQILPSLYYAENKNGDKAPFLW